MFKARNENALKHQNRFTTIFFNLLTHYSTLSYPIASITKKLRHIRFIIYSKYANKMFIYSVFAARVKQNILLVLSIYS